MCNVDKKIKLIESFGCRVIGVMGNGNENDLIIFTHPEIGNEHGIASISLVISKVTRENIKLKLKQKMGQFNLIEKFKERRCKYCLHYSACKKEGLVFDGCPIWESNQK